MKLMDWKDWVVILSVSTIAGLIYASAVFVIW